MARPTEKDPLDKFRWTVKIEGFTRVGFTQCGVPAISYNTRSYAEGGKHLFPKKIIDSVEYKPVTLSRGVTTDQSFSNWARQAIELTRGKTEQATTSDKGIEEANTTLEKLTQLRNAANPGRLIVNPEPLDSTLKIPLEFRRDVVIEHRNRAGSIVKKYILYNAIPIEFSPASDFQSDGDDVLSLETLVLAYEGFEVISSNVDSNPTDVTDVFKRGLRRGLKIF